MKYKIPLVLLILFGCLNSLVSQNYLMVESQQGYLNETTIFQTLLINNDPVRAIQFDLELPNGFTLDVDNVATTERTIGFSIATSFLSGTTYRIILFNTSNLFINPGDLSIATLPIFIEQDVTPGVYVFNFNDVIISDATNQNVSSPPLETGEIIIVVANAPSPIAVCDGNNDGFAVFDLLSKDAEVLGEQTGLIVSYYETQADAASNTNTIANPSAYTNSIPTNQTVFVRITDTSSGAFDLTSLELIVQLSPTPIEPNPLEICDINNDGFAVFDLTVLIPEILGSQDPISFQVIFYEDESDAQSGNANFISVPSSFENTTVDTQILFARLENLSSGCFGVVALVLNVNDLPLVNLVSDYTLLDINNDGIETFDLNTRIPEIIGIQDPASFQVSFYVSEADAQSDTNKILLPGAYTNSSNPQVIYVRITTITTACYTLNQFIIFAEPNLGIGDEGTSTIILYPNPTSGKLFMEGISELEIELAIFNSIGQAVFSDKLKPYNGVFSIDLSELKQGLYFINISFKETQETFKIIIN